MNRQLRRFKHKLVVVPLLKSPFPGLRVGSFHKQYACTCGRGWMSLSIKKPVEAFEQHIASFFEKPKEGAAP